MWMTAETVCDLLRPLIGKSGSVFMVVSEVGQVGFSTTSDKKLTGVEARPDGLVRLDRETGWGVIDPGEGGAVVWDRGEEDPPPGHSLEAPPGMAPAADAEARGKVRYLPAGFRAPGLGGRFSSRST